MEIRQLRYFVRVVELGSMGRASQDLGVVTSALSQQIARLESELSTRLLQRSSQGVVPTEAGMAFLRQARLVLRHMDSAMEMARQARLDGSVSIGMAPTTATILAVPFVQTMRERYPDVHLHIVENLSGNLFDSLQARQIDLAILFGQEVSPRFSQQALLDERLFFVARSDFPGLPPRLSRTKATLRGLAHLPMVLPSRSHGLRIAVEAGCARARVQTRIVAEIDGLAPIMSMVASGAAATIQPGAALTLDRNNELLHVPLADEGLTRKNWIASLNDEELSTAALAARVTLRQVAQQLVESRRWPGATLLES